MANIDLYIFCGQSNSVGTRRDQIIQLEPNCTFSDVNGTHLDKVVAGEVAFGNEIARATENDVHILKFGVGSTALAQTAGPDWSAQSQGELYDQLIAHVMQSIADLESQGHVVAVTGLVWMQGEADGNRGFHEEYRDNLTAHIANLRADLGAPELKVVVGQVNRAGENHDGLTLPTLNEEFLEVQRSQQAVAAADDLVTYVATDDLGMRDIFHYTIDAYESIGARFAAPFLEGPGVDSPEVLIGTDGGDSFGGSWRVDRIAAGDGNDVLRGEGGHDVLYGGQGDDHLYGDGGQDSLWGGLGDDYLFGGMGGDYFMGGDGNDRIYGEHGFDTVRAGDGNDMVSGGEGDDRLHGEGGADILTGDEGNDRIVGGGGNDILFGGVGDDHLVGNAGNDILHGGIGADRMSGGDGYDLVSYDGTESIGARYGVFVDLAGIASNSRGATGDVLIGIEGLIGTGWADQLRGDDGDNQLFGGGRSDRLYGRQGDDVLDGGEGADAIYGNRGADRLTGGADEATDRFIYFHASDSRVGEGNRDIITDFDPGTDRIELSRLDADPGTAGNQAFTFLGAQAFTSSAGELRFDVLADERTVVQGDMNGDGAADFEIELLGALELSVEDFLL